MQRNAETRRFKTSRDVRFPSVAGMSPRLVIETIGIAFLYCIDGPVELVGDPVDPRTVADTVEGAVEAAAASSIAA